MSLKTKEMRRILDPIETQINKLRCLLLNDPQNSNTLLVKPMLLEQLRTLGEKLETLPNERTRDYEQLKKRMTDIIEEFCTMKDINKLMDNVDKNVAEDIMTVLLNKFELALKTLEDLEYLPLKQSILDCQRYINEMGNTKEIEDFQNIRELGISILGILEQLQKYGKNLISQLLSNKIALLSCQLCTAFNLLIQLVQEQHQLNASIYSCKKYICGRLCLCLKMIVEVLDSDNPMPDDENQEFGNHFVYRMDLVLDIISEIYDKNREEQVAESADIWLGIEDIFSHAMAIAQLCKPYNFNEIVGACQSIVLEYENLKFQLTSKTPDPAMDHLFMNTLNDALYRLEQKINVSILNLVLEVFSEPFGALKKLIASCGNSLSAEKRSQSDLTSAIEDFDQIIDKSMQVGMFAIACCKDMNRINRMRNCLAGLESLETELVSAITSFYLHPDNKEMRASVKLLTAQWRQEINNLHNVLDLIIDSGAYCQVILDDLQERISTMSDCLDHREPVTQAQVQGVVQVALCLSRQISATLNDIGSDIVERQTIIMTRELKAAIFEADSASRTLLLENATGPQQLRVIKRCELILNVVKRLQPALVAIMNNTILMNTYYQKARRGQGEFSHANRLSSTVCKPFGNDKPVVYVRTPYTVKTHKSQLSIQPANGVPRKQLDISCLIPYIKKGRTIRCERSIMYKTPRGDNDAASSKNKLKMRNLSSVRQHLFSRDSISSNVDFDLSNETFKLSGIIDKLTFDSFVDRTASPNSFSKTEQNISSSAMQSNWSTTQSVNTSLKQESTEDIRNVSLSQCCTIGGGDAPSNVQVTGKYDDTQTIDNPQKEELPKEHHVD
ncbi:hypothetical protein KM043_001235 [Ampulex compressa]|nr:hypothetical protein KM043_001235 [Ampulex compressa]